MGPTVLKSCVSLALWALRVWLPAMGRVLLVSRMGLGTPSCFIARPSGYFGAWETYLHIDPKTWAYICVCIYAYMRVCMYACMHVRMYACMHACMHASAHCMFVNACCTLGVYARMRMCILKHSCVFFPPLTFSPDLPSLDLQHGQDCRQPDQLASRQEPTC